MRMLRFFLLFLLSIILLVACGGSQTTQVQSRSIKSVIKAAALTADKNIAGINLTITVPVGVAPAGGSSNPAATVEITSSSPTGQTLPGMTYIPATATATGKLSVSAIVAAGFSANDQITIHLTVADGATPVAADFRLLSFEAFDIDGAPVTGLSPSITTTIIN